MLEAMGMQSLNELLEQTVPYDIRLPKLLQLPEPLSEAAYLQHIHALARKNTLCRNLIGRGYYGTQTPAVIMRHVFENPSWYTSYTPYQAEISQGRLEALLNFQTMVSSLTAMELANASLLDEATAAAEAMLMMYALRSRQDVKAGRNVMLVDERVFPHTVDVLITRAAPQGIEIARAACGEYQFTGREFGLLVQYPDSEGEVRDYSALTARAHEAGVLVTVAADLLSLAMLVPPGEWGADVVVGSTQRFGIPMGLGGPHAAYFATRMEYKRSIPGRLIGVSVDRLGNQALRMALQTREQHIKRAKATSNICTAQALLATMAGMFAVWHGPEGILRIAENAHSAAQSVIRHLSGLGVKVQHVNVFDTVRVELPAGVVAKVRELSVAQGFNFDYPAEGMVGFSFDELSTPEELSDVVSIIAEAMGKSPVRIEEIKRCTGPAKSPFARRSAFLTEEVFGRYRSETEMMRYIHRLVEKDIALNCSMISLGSCTMKLTSAASMLPLSWPEFANMHPFQPADQLGGYRQLIGELEGYLSEITGFAATSLQPNSGAAGEYAGLMVIRQYHLSRGDSQRTVALIPTSAHGTNPASAAMAGMEIVLVDCDAKGNIDVDDLRRKAQEHGPRLSAFMVTYPSTHGIFESRIREMMDIVHENGGQVYMDGANMNAQVGLTSPGYIGADVCHLNLHKTFSIPHGGGGPGVGPICVAAHLAEFLPGHTEVEVGGGNAIHAVSGAPWGSAYILPITYAYIRMLGAEGLMRASQLAILNANYIVARLGGEYSALYAGEMGRVGHECIVDCRHFREQYGVETGDIARRLMDYGFHAPTLSFPVHETLMVEPTESESKEEIDRFCDALISIKRECEAMAGQEDNLVKNAPHTSVELCCGEWAHAYSREQAAFPLAYLRHSKYWPTVSRIDAAQGDRHLMCSCQDWKQEY